MFSKKAKKIEKITSIVNVKSTVKIWSIFVAFLNRKHELYKLKILCLIKKYILH